MSDSKELRFDGRVVIVTGAGGALGRAHALLFASRGASVVVNDLGTPAAGGEGRSSEPAIAVVEEIKKMGGQAVANFDSVEDGDKIVQTAIDAFGRVDIVINNAGILRDVSYHKMTQGQWDLIMRVHLNGAHSVTRAAWPHFRKQKYGRVINTTSAAGLYGNFGQVNYSAAKMALVGFTTALAKEGARRNIFSNVIAPVAGSRMTETVLPPDLVAALKPDYVSPLVAYLCHENTDVNGQIFEVGAGWVAAAKMARNDGHNFPLSKPFTPEAVASQWDQITDFTNHSYPESPAESLGCLMDNLSTEEEAPQSKL